jgi:hypothetical protein
MSGPMERAAARSGVLEAHLAHRDRAPASGLAPRPPVDGAPVGAHSANIVILAVVVALLDLEQRRDRGKVRPPMDLDRSA